MEQINCARPKGPWNKGKLVGQKAPLRLKEIWAIRIRLQLARNTRELALFNLAVDSKLRSCDLLKLRVREHWVREIGLDPAAYGTHTLRRTKASLIY
jgi:hypothetical protein